MAEADPKFVNIHDAKTNFSKLVDRAHAGEEIVVAKGGKPWAKLVPFVEASSRLPRQPGRYRHLLGKLPPDAILAPAFTDDELDAFETKLDRL